MDKKINDKLKKAKDLITNGQTEEALDLLHTVLMSDCTPGLPSEERERADDAWTLRNDPQALSRSRGDLPEVPRVRLGRPAAAHGSLA